MSMKYNDLIEKADQYEAEYWLAELMYFGAIEGLKEPALTPIS